MFKLKTSFNLKPLIKLFFSKMAFKNEFQTCPENVEIGLDIWEVTVYFD